MTGNPTSALAGIDPSLLDFNDPPQLVWIKVQDAARLLWRNNPKEHDIGALVESVVEYGYKEPAIFSAKLYRVGQPDTDDEPLGALVVGNGRIEALARLEQSGDVDLPRGLATEKETGDWAVWIIAGTDAKSRDMARAYGIDSNLLGMMGGSLSHLDMARVWDEQAYLKLLEDLARHDALPVSMDDDDLDLLKEVLSIVPPALDALEEKFGDPNPRDFWPEVKLQVSPETFVLFAKLMEQAEGEDEPDKFHNIMLLASDYLGQVTDEPGEG